jgi:RNA methyltransferase, RsmD family
MRVIAGKARRIVLKTLEGSETRPTTDRIKETLFNIISPDLTDCEFLDLFAGSGAIGIEALSRGAESAVFVENSKGAVECIKANLKATRLEEKASILNMDALSSINTLNMRGRQFDIIFMDPPYNRSYEQGILEALMHCDLLKQGAMIIVEASLDTTFDYLEGTDFQIFRQKEYKTNKHVFIEKVL